MAFVDAFNLAFTIKRDTEDIMKQKIPLSILMDSRSFCDVWLNPLILICNG